MKTARNPSRLAAGAAAAVLVLAGCGQDQPRGNPLTGGEAAPTVQGQPSPHGGTLPEGHPPIPAGGSPGSMGMGAAPQAAAELSWELPEGWTQSPPTSGMRMAQFDLPGKWDDGGTVQCVVFTLMAGGIDGNIQRWKGQVTPPGGATQDSLAKVTTTERDGMTISRIEMTGSYTDGMARPPRTSDDAMFLGAVIAPGGGDQVYTVKLAGPRKVVEPEVAKFDALLASLRPK